MSSAASRGLGAKDTLSPSHSYSSWKDVLKINTLRYFLVPGVTCLPHWGPEPAGTHISGLRR